MPIRQDTLRERWLAQQGYAETTQQTYRETLGACQRRFPAYAEKVTEAMLVDFLTTEANGEPATRAPSTLDRQRATLRSFWRWAHRQGYVKVDPAAELDELRFGHAEARPGRWLTRDEVWALLDCTRDGSEQGDRDYTLIITAVLTGLRRSELAGLTWRHVDLSQCRVSVKGKGGKFATIGLPEQAAEALRNWQALAASLQGRRKVRPDDPVFPTGKPVGGLHKSDRVYLFYWDRPISKWGIRAIIARRANEAALGTVATHDLRRTFADLLDQEGRDLKDIQAALRHSEPTVTARCYLDRSPRRAVAAVADLRLIRSDTAT